MTEASGAIGRPVVRNEDEQFLRGEGMFLDDIQLPGTLHCAFLRSPLAHARILSIDVEKARQSPGVVAVYTHEDLGEHAKPLPLLFPHPDMPYPSTQHPLAVDEVNYVGQTVAMVVAENRYLAEDALDHIDVDYEPLPVVTEYEVGDTEEALVHDEFPTNVAADSTWSVGDPDRAFAEADVIIKERLVCERSAAMPMEMRGVVARFDPETRGLTVWDSTQCPLPVRSALIASLGLPENRVRVIAPDTGGGFGLKGYLLYPEELLIPLVALKLRATVKWTEDRSEHFVGSNHQRGQVHHIELAATSDGVITGLRDRFLHDQGAYIAYGLITPQITASHIAGQYGIPNIEVRFLAVYTNKVPVSPMRSVGRPQACFALERSLDRLAEEVGVDRIEIRRRNLLQPDQFPYERDGLFFAGYPVVLDSGDYPQQLDALLDAIDHAGFLREQAEAREEGRYIGLGLATYVEGTGEGPYEGARVFVQPVSGKIYVATGLTSQGQSHKTTFAQVAADVLSADPGEVIVEEGNTGAFSFGAGTFGSRAIVNCANAVALAATEVKEKAVSYAASMLEASPEDCELQDGRISVIGSPDRSVSLHEVAVAINPIRYTTLDPSIPDVTEFGSVRPGTQFGQGDGPALEATAYYAPSSTTWTSGAQAAIVEVDPRTGDVTYLRYAIAHDCGVLVNPSVVAGQVMGGVALGIAGSFYERMAYDEGGQLKNASFMDFLMPYATEIPEMEIVHLETPSPLNPLGIKGAGEAGSIAGPALTAAAIEDALAPSGVKVNEMPLDPARLKELIGPG